MVCVFVGGDGITGNGGCHGVVVGGDGVMMIIVLKIVVGDGRRLW